MNSYDFDTHGQLVIDGQTIDHGDFAEILITYFDGLCPVCNEAIEINHGQIICDSCFDRARAYREQYGY